ncbi:MAG: helix-hairpin-helix domain-containing protein [Rhodothermaceae bacterium]|nr:helix-hairpin-helix domain-containing protein [Rhodothermaceae bacterium]
MIVQSDPMGLTREDSPDLIISQIFQSIDDQNQEAENGIESTLDLLHFYYRNPIDLNTCTYSELRALPFIDALTAKDIIDLRNELGALSSLSDLLVFPSISLKSIQRLRPFVYLSASPGTSPLSSSHNNYPPRTQKRRTTIIQSVAQQFEKPFGFKRPIEEGGYYGTPSSISTRFISESSNGINTKFVMEKDPGEAFRKISNQKNAGPDHLEIALWIKRNSFVRQLILGHYTLQFGQGLLLSSRFNSTKGSNPTKDPLRTFSRIRPSASRVEGKSFRGIASHFSIMPPFSLVVFYSNRDQDATLNPYGPDSSLGVTTIQRTGLHRTRSEMERKDRLTETTAGIVFTYTTPAIEIGYARYTTAFSHPFISIRPRSKVFSGSGLKGWSFFGSAQINFTQTSWEVAKSQPGSLAILTSVLLKPTPACSVLFLWRHYSGRYFSFHGQGFGERSQLTNNETGFYIGYSLELSPRIQSTFYADVYEWPGINPRSGEKPRAGFEAFGKIEYKPRNWLSGSLQFRYESSSNRSQYFASAIQGLYSASRRTRLSGTFRLEFKHSAMLHLSTHIQVKQGTINGIKSYGILAYQGLTYRPSAETKISLRFSIFDSKRNDSILYAFENDLQYRFGIKSYSGQGLRDFIVIKHTLIKNVLIEVKYAHTRYNNITNKGTGNNAISTRRIRELAGQVSWRF